MSSVLKLAFLTFLLVALSGCATAPSTGGRAGILPDIELLEAQLQKGISTEADVEQLLGKPIGEGGALSGLEPDRPRALWVYGEGGWSLIGLEGTTGRIHVDQQLLMVFFVDGRFDGYWWNSHGGPVKVRVNGE